MDTTTHPTTTPADQGPPPVRRSTFHGLGAVIAFVALFEAVLWIDDLVTPCEELGCLWPIVPPVLAAYALVWVIAPVTAGLFAWERWGDPHAARSAARRWTQLLWITAIGAPFTLLLFG